MSHDGTPQGRTANGLALDPEQRRRYGRLAALLFAGGSLGTLPAAFLLDPVPEAEILLVTALGVLTASICWALPWQRLPDWSLDLAATVGTLEVLLVCEMVDETYRVLYFVIVVFAALALPSRGRVLLQVGVVLLALAVPILSDDDAKEGARIVLLGAPCFLIVGGAVRYLRETLESRDRTSRAFAREAIELAIRLRRGTSRDGEDRESELAELERAIERLR
jgi:hypothetical protein